MNAIVRGGKLVMLGLSLAVLMHAQAVRAEEKAEKPKKEVKDMSSDELEEAGRCPVCRNEHKLVYHFEAGGKTYHFATRKCQKEFSENPEKFGVKADPKKETAKKSETPPAKEEKKSEDEGGMGGGMMGQ